MGGCKRPIEFVNAISVTVQLFYSTVRLHYSSTKHKSRGYLPLAVFQPLFKLVSFSAQFPQLGHRQLKVVDVSLPSIQFLAVNIDFGRHQLLEVGEELVVVVVEGDWFWGMEARVFKQGDLLEQLVL